MPFAYQAEMWCDRCGERIARELDRDGIPDDGDSDGYPQRATADETDSPEHCAERDGCLAAIDLRDWGMGRRARLEGAETYRIGAIVNGGLTDYGVEYLREMLADRPRTPYQRALHALWEETYRDHL